LAAARNRAKDQLLRLPEPLRRLEPHTYSVEIDRHCANWLQSSTTVQGSPVRALHWQTGTRQRHGLLEPLPEAGLLVEAIELDTAEVVT
jgi:hypothetical protein